MFQEHRNNEGRSSLTENLSEAVVHGKEMSKTVQTLLFKEFVRPRRVITGVPQNRDVNSAITVSSSMPWLPTSPAKKRRKVVEKDQLRC